jgi:mannitol/fructose-specific phosphotransferase system IIA component (Ntr-type)
MKLSELVNPKAIVPQLKGARRDEVIPEIVDALVAAGALAKSLRDEVIKHIIDREKKGSTGFGKGVAVPHVKHEKIKKMQAGIGVSGKGVDFNALDKEPVHSIILLLSPAEQPDQHLHAMESIVSNLQLDTFRRFLRQATTVAHVTDLLSEADARTPHR